MLRRDRRLFFFYGGTIQPLLFLLLIAPSQQGNEKLDFGSSLRVAVPDPRAVSQDINLD